MRNEAYREMAKNSTEYTKIEYSRLEKAAWKAVARSMKEEAVIKINQLGRNPNNVFIFVSKMKKESTDVVGGRCMRGNYEILYLNETDRANLWKTHI